MMELLESTQGQLVHQDEPHPEKPYHPKRPHKKSRLGCIRCKHRRVKCDEVKPTCSACTARREDCTYPVSPSPSSTAPPSSGRASLSFSRRSSPGPRSEDDGGLCIANEPVFRPSGADEEDLRLLWFYTTKTYGSFALRAGREPVIDNILKVKVLQCALQSPFLMDCVLGLSALHLQYLKQEISPRRAISYRVRAFEGYRKAIERANPNDFPALLACSLLLCALASQTFREPDAKDVFLIDWMIVWRGIGLIVELITPEAMFASGMQMLFNRPRLDLDKAALRIPNNLLFMVTSIKDGDVDFPYRDAYYDTLKYLGALYLELEAGFSPILDLSIITFFTFLPKPFIEVARQRRPRSLIILVYYAVFAKLIDRVWWMEGIADREILGICRMLSDEWLPLLQVPRMAVRVQNKVDLATLLLGNHAWEPSLEEDRPDPRDKTLAILDDYGQEVEYVGRWVTRLTFAPRPGESRDMMETGPHFRGDTVL